MSAPRRSLGPTPLDEDLGLEGLVVSDRYRVERLLGTGGMGTVWKGVHLDLGTPVAIKFVRRAFAERPEARKRFAIEARAAASVQSLHAVRVLDFGTTADKRSYLVMEYLEGAGLADTILDRGRLPLDEVARILGQAARALDRAHAAGIVHRDLKPDNIVLATNVERPDATSPYTVKLVDFGIAKILDDALLVGPGSMGGLGGATAAGSVVGTPNFMSPEQLTVGAAPSPLTDVWALGACAFTAATGRLPFEGDVIGEIVLRVCSSPMPVPSAYAADLPRGFDAWFAKTCARDPKKRFTSAGEAAAALAALVRTPSQAALEDPDRVGYVMRRASSEELVALDDPKPGMSARTALLAGIVVGICAMIGLLGLFAYRLQMEREQAGGAPVEAAALPRPDPAPAPAPSPRPAPVGPATGRSPFAPTR